MEVKVLQGNLLQSQASIVIVPASCDGFTASGLMSNLRDEDPCLTEEYRKGCFRGHACVGSAFGGTRYVRKYDAVSDSMFYAWPQRLFVIPVKDIWNRDADLEDVLKALEMAKALCKALDFSFVFKRSLAMPVDDDTSRVPLKGLHAIFQDVLDILEVWEHQSTPCN